ncbi:MAG: rhodanese-like domain-containing protein [Thiotrichaceae bacterium]|nr:rhodanese-like domain-containing protein [Thiotrichaceae bacterium]
MKSYQDLVQDCLPQVKELMPWDLTNALISDNPPILLDIREPYEYQTLHLNSSLNVPRGILEAACDYGYEDTVPELATARDKDIVVMCRSGNRSILAAYVMQLMGYQSVKSLKTGVKGWNDYEQPLYNQQNELVDTDTADDMLNIPVRPDQLARKTS